MEALESFERLPNIFLLRVSDRRKALLRGEWDMLLFIRLQLPLETEEFAFRDWNSKEFFCLGI